MNISMFLFFVILLAASIYTSRKIWTEPQEYLNEAKGKRLRFIGSLTGKKFLLSKSDNYPEKIRHVELWFGRLIFVLLYLGFLFGIIVALTSH